MATSAHRPDKNTVTRFIILYNQGHPLKRIEKVTGFSATCVKNYLIKNNIKLRPSGFQNGNQFHKLNIGRKIPAHAGFQKGHPDYRKLTPEFRKILAIRMSRNMSGINNYSNRFYKANRTRGSGWVWNRAKIVVRSVWGNTCLCCERPAVDFHHIIPYEISKDNSLGNLIPLCKPHHMTAEGMIVQFMDLKLNDVAKTYARDEWIEG